MQLPTLFYLSLMWIPASNARDAAWTINVIRRIKAMRGSNITILCTFTYPQEEQTKNVQVYWKTPGRSQCSKNNKDKEAFVFHPNSSCVLSNYMKKTKLIGKKNKGSCSLQIFNIEESNPNIYLRVVGLRKSYSFVKNYVNISVEASSLPYVGNIKMYLAIFVPVLGLLIIVAAGAVTYTIHKRLPNLERKESGYYVNFRRTSSNLPKSELACKTSHTKPQEDEATVESLYINFQTASRETEEDVEYREHFYGNVD